MKKSRLRKASKTPISVLQRRLWVLCRDITRLRHGNTCYTCGRGGLVGSNWHTGHMFAKASLGAYLKYDLRVLRPQCYNCNINQGGRGADFYARMLREEGEEYMAKLEEDKKILLKAYDHYAALVPEYERILASLKENPTDEIEYKSI